MDGNFKFTFGGKEFKAPSGLAIDKNDNVYVCEIGNDRIQVFDKDGNFLGAWGREGSGDGELGNLHGVIVDPAHRRKGGATAAVETDFSRGRRRPGMNDIRLVNSDQSANAARE